MDNLTVEHRERLSKPRRSVIGKLERSSFQAQRLSDVGVAFSQQITAKVGLKLPASQERIVEQTRWLYLRYVFVRLRQNQLPLRDLNLTKSSRARRAGALGLTSQVGCLADATKIVVSISEPPSADIINLDDNGACNEDFIKQSPIFNRSRHQTARTRSTQINLSDLSKLTALCQSSIKSRASPSPLLVNLNHNNNNNNNYNCNTTTRSHNQSSTTQSRYLKKINGNRFIIAPNHNSGDISSNSGDLYPNRLHATTNKPENHQISSSIPTTDTATANATATARKFVMDPTINNQIFTVILNTITELRDLKPEFYSDTIYEVIGIDKFSSLESLLDVQLTICQEMTRSEIDWDRIIALFSLFGAMSLDCVRLGSPEHVGPILDGFIGFVERDLALWISQKGGWESFLYKCQAGFRYGPIYKGLALAVPLVVWAIYFAIT